MAIDGEGCICISGKPDRPNSLYPTISFSNTSEDLTETVRDMINPKFSIFHNTRKRTSANGTVLKVNHSVKFSAVKDILCFLLQIEPYLVAKKEQCKLMIEFCNSRLLKREANYYPAYDLREWKIHDEISNLNDKKGIKARLGDI